MVLAATASLIAAIASASPQGAEWTVLDAPAACGSCHLGSPDPTDSAAVTIEGLPAQILPGQRLELEIVLTDPALQIGGFLLAVTAGDMPAGEIRAVDAGTEVDGARARSTRAGALPLAPGTLRWKLRWTAPASLSAPVRFEVWANAGNDDLSPLGDRLHQRILLIPVGD